ncbi:MAG: hypothetical protein ISR58_22280, partial [Anaerolineales bacterium]|nr:hypothetical protein [Anaerolineales bacterium]
PSVHVADQYGLSKRSDRRKREAAMLWLVAQGHTLRIEIQRIVAEYFETDHRTGALMAVIPGLIDKGLLHREGLSVPGVRSYGMLNMDAVHLTDAGRELVSGFSWPVTETELERMRRLHEKGKTENEHTAAVLAFTYHARLRGWKSGVMPKVATVNYRYAPDAVVAKDDCEYHVEVELSWKVADPKWRNMARSRGVVALCARHESHQQALVGDVESIIGANAPIMATNLRTLFKDVQEEPLGKLWLERW